LAARGARDMDRGEERVADADAARQLRARALQIHVEAVVAASLLTGLGLLIAVGVGG
jgi:hypothetical protein